MLRNPLDKEPGKTQGIDLKSFLSTLAGQLSERASKQKVEVYKGSTLRDAVCKEEMTAKDGHTHDNIDRVFTLDSNRVLFCVIFGVPFAFLAQGTLGLTFKPKARTGCRSRWTVCAHQDPKTH